MSKVRKFWVNSLFVVTKKEHMSYIITILAHLFSPFPAGSNPSHYDIHLFQTLSLSTHLNSCVVSSWFHHSSLTTFIRHLSTPSCPIHSNSLILQSCVHNPIGLHVTQQDALNNAISITESKTLIPLFCCKRWCARRH